MRSGVLAGLLMAAALALPASAEVSRTRNSPAVAATAPTPVNANRTYDQPMDALIAADLDYLVTDARRAFTTGDTGIARGMLVFLDEMAAGRWSRARETLTAMPAGIDGEGGDFFEPFLLAAEGNVTRAIERTRGAQESLPDPLPDLARALIYEGAGRLQDAARVYREIEQTLDVRPPPDGEPQSLEDFQRLLTANRTTHTLYRAALVQHRLRNRAEARRLYQLAAAFAPHSPDIEANLERLGRGASPVEPALDERRALGRWLAFMADYFGQTEGLATLLTAEGPIEGLASPSSAMFLQFALLLDPAADDWRIFAAAQLMAAEGSAGAERLIAPIRSNSPYAPEAELMRAGIALQRHEDAAAAQAARRALQLGGERWSILTGAGDVFRSTGQAEEAQAVFNRALALADDAEQRSDVLRYRAYAHRFAGDIDAAVEDARQALALHRSDDTRTLYVSILMDDPEVWSEGIREARLLFAERPNSVSRLNTLGYALIQRPEGLNEGYRLLWRGFLLGERDYAVIDSLGWAYYLHGAFDQAAALIERADALTGHDKNAEILDHLGDVYWRLDRRDEARDAWREALQARPDAIRRRALEAKLENGMTEPAPQPRELPPVELPNQSRDDT